MYEAQQAQAIVPVNRSERLIEAAVDAFGTHGYQGASLRDIAREAGSSVTLIAHHFGAKSGLVAAVVQRLHRAGRGTWSFFGGAVQHAPELNLATLVEAWTRYAFSLFGHRAGAPWLRVMLRLRTEEALDAEASESLDASEATVRQALRTLYPEASDATIEFAWDLSSGALYTALSRATMMEAGAPEGLLRRSVEAALKSLLEGLFKDARRPGER